MLPWTVRYLLLALLGACTVGLSAAGTLRVTAYPPLDTYCEPMQPDVELCRDDAEAEWRCVADEFGWKCKYVGQAVPVSHGEVLP